MSSLQQGGRGTQACINAHTAVQGIIGDLDTTLMFVSSGALNPEEDNETFADYRFVAMQETRVQQPLLNNLKLGLLFMILELVVWTYFRQLFLSNLQQHKSEANTARLPQTCE